jgi:hypothetical protein
MMTRNRFLPNTATPSMGKFSYRNPEIPTLRKKE